MWFFILFFFLYIVIYIDQAYSSISSLGILFQITFNYKIWGVSSWYFYFYLHRICWQLYWLKQFILQFKIQSVYKCVKASCTQNTYFKHELYGCLWHKSLALYINYVGLQLWKISNLNFVRLTFISFSDSEFALVWCYFWTLRNHPSKYKTIIKL